MGKKFLLASLLLANQLSLASQHEPNDFSGIFSSTIAQCNIGNIIVINQLPSDICDGDDNLYKEIAEEFIESEEINVNNHSTILLQECGSSFDGGPLFAFSIPPRSKARVCVFDINDHEIALIHITKENDMTNEIQ